jgi:hypothetical protein
VPDDAVENFRRHFVRGGELEVPHVADGGRERVVQVVVADAVFVARPGTGVMILKIFSRKILAKNSVFDSKESFNYAKI